MCRVICRLNKNRPLNCFLQSLPRYQSAASSIPFLRNPVLLWQLCTNTVGWTTHTNTQVAFCVFWYDVDDGLRSVVTPALSNGGLTVVKHEIGRKASCSCMTLVHLRCFSQSELGPYQGCNQSGKSRGAHDQIKRGTLAQIFKILNSGLYLVEFS